MKMTNIFEIRLYRKNAIFKNNSACTKRNKHITVTR